MKKEKTIAELIEKVIGEMRRTGTGESTLRYYKRDGFNKIEEYFRQNGAATFSEKLSVEFIYLVRERYENGEITKNRWYYARRSAEILVHYEETGSVILRQLIHWQYLHNKMRQEPTEEQLCEQDNIYALIWKVKQTITALGYVKGTLYQYNSYGFDPLIRRHEENGLSAYCPDAAKRLADEYYENFRKGLLKTGGAYRTMRKTIALIEEYRKTGKIEWRMLPPIKTWKASAYFEDILEKFKENILQAGNLSITTVKNIVIAARSFLKEIEKLEFHNFDGISLKTASDCIIRISKDKKSGLKNFIFGVRIFLNYLYENDITVINLSDTVPKMTAHWKKNHEGFSVDEMKELLAVPNRETARGKRDFAIMTLAAQTGLRGVDIENLKYSDIDWRKNEIRIIQHKTGVAHWLPLEPESGNAIADYILNGRAECESPNVFVRCRRPFQPLGLRSVSNIVTKNIQKSSLDFGGKSRLGSHSFRRAFGTGLLEAQIPFDQLSQLLGHTDINSSKPYLSANETGLRECALGLPNGGDAI